MAVAIVISGCEAGGATDAGLPLEAMVPIDAAGLDAYVESAADATDAVASDAGPCGNGRMDPGEVCDDGNAAGGDGCRADCRGLEQCGDGFFDANELCLAMPPRRIALGEPALAGPFLADVDGDGSLDVLVALGSESQPQLVRLTNDGRGALGPPTDTGAGAVGVFGDLDDDRDADLVAHRGNDLVVYLAEGGAFAETSALAAPSPTGALALGDLDGDQKVDVAFASAERSRVFVLRGDGAGALSAGPVFMAGEMPQRIALANLDGDRGGSLDVVLTHSLQTSNVGFMINDRGTLGAPVFVDTVFPRGLAVADIDGDGDLDVITGSQGSMALGIVRNQRGRPASPSAEPMPGYPVQVRAADFDGDGDVDVMARLLNGPIELRANDGRAGLSTVVRSLELAVAGPFEVGDLDGDGNVEIVMLPPGGRTLVVYRRVP